MNKHIILVGLQGSGKGTQAKILAEKFGYTIFETGAVLRAMAKEDSELGRTVKDITTRGDLVPNEIVMKIVQDFIAKHPGRKVIFDGIPRSEPQRKSLEALLDENDMKFMVLEITLSDDEAMNRLLKRAEIEGRADDNRAVIERRIQNFYEHTAPLLEIWRQAGKVKTVNGDQAIEGVTSDILELF